MGLGDCDPLCTKKCMEHSGQVERIDQSVDKVNKLEKKLNTELSDAVEHFTECANQMNEATVSLNQGLETMKHFNSFGQRINELEGKWKIREAIENEDETRTEKAIKKGTLIVSIVVGIATLIGLAINLLPSIPHG